MTTVGLVGCGQWGLNILRDLRKLGARVRVVARSPASRARALRHVPESEIVLSAAELGKADGIVVATPTSTHAAAIEDVLGFGMPVFVEKPLTGSSEEARRFRDVAGRIFVMDKWRYHPGIHEIRGWRERGTLGRLLGLRALRVQDGNPHPDVPAVWTYLPHDLASVYEILGRLPEARDAVGAGRGAFMRAFLGFETPWVALEMSTLEAKKARTLSAYFEKGTLELETRGFESVLHVRPHEESETQVVWDRCEPLLHELEAFLLYLRGGGPPPKSSFEEGLEQVVRIESLISLSGTP